MLTMYLQYILVHQFTCKGLVSANKHSFCKLQSAVFHLKVGCLDVDLEPFTAIESKPDISSKVSACRYQGAQAETSRNVRHSAGTLFPNSERLANETKIICLNSLLFFFHLSYPGSSNRLDLAPMNLI